MIEEQKVLGPPQAAPLMEEINAVAMWYGANNIYEIYINWVMGRN